MSEDNNPAGLPVPFPAAQITHVAWFAQDNTGELIAEPVVAWLPVTHDYPPNPKHVEWKAAVCDNHGDLILACDREIGTCFDAEYIGVTRASAAHPALGGIPAEYVDRQVHIAKNGNES